MEGKANDRKKERESSKWREVRAKSRESQLSPGKRRSPATSSLTAVNGPSLRRNTVRKRSRENKRLRARWMETATRGNGKRERKRRRRGEGDRKENEKGDTFITRRRATGKIERQVVFACGSLPGPRGECGRRGRGRRIEKTQSHVGETRGDVSGKTRYTRLKGHAHRGTASISFSMQNKILQIPRAEGVTHACSYKK